MPSIIVCLSAAALALIDAESRNDFYTEFSGHINQKNFALELGFNKAIGMIKGKFWHTKVMVF